MQCALFFILTCALTLGACSDDPVSEPGTPSLGVVEVRTGQSIQIRSLLAHTIAPSLGQTQRRRR